MALGVVGTDFRRTVWHQPSWIVTQALVRLVVALQTEAVRAAVDVLALRICSHKFKVNLNHSALHLNHSTLL